MSFQNKELIDISFDEFDSGSPKSHFTKKTHISDLFEDFSPSTSKLPNSVQEFLMRSDQIQEDLRRNSSPNETPSYLRKLNSKLKESGLNPIQPNPPLESLYSILDQVLSDLIQSRSQEKLLNKELEQNKSKEKSENRLKRNAGLFDNFDYESNDENLEDLFKEVMNKSFDSRNEDDVNIYTFIKYVEMQRNKTLRKLDEVNLEKESLAKELKEMQEKNKEIIVKLKKTVALVENNEKIRIIESVCNELEIKNVKELPEAIKKFQQVMFALPGVEKFVSEVSEEFVGEYGCKKMEDIVPSIRNLKKQLAECEEFKKRVFLAFGSDKVKDIVNFGRAISHFCKLFEVPSPDKLLSTVEELFYFVRQIKGFVMVQVI